jgi:hypothetical protein
MGSISSAAAFIAVATLSFAQEKTPAAARWDGSFLSQNKPVEFTVNLDQDDKGLWIGTINLPVAGLADLPLANVVVEGLNVSFVIPGAPGEPAFKGTISEGGNTLSGTITQSKGTAPFSAKRAGPAKVVLPPKSSIISPDLEGTWEGALAAANRTLRVVLHVARAADGTGSATLDSPDQNAKGLPVNSIKQDGQKFSFDSKLIGATYYADLNQDHTEMNGKLSQRGRDVGLVLKKAK